MSGKEGGKSRRTTPASVPGAVSVPPTEEPRAEARAPAPAPPRDDSTPVSPSGKSRRTTAQATIPGAGAVAVAAEEPDTGAAPVSPKKARSSGKSRRTTAPATTPGAVAVAAEEPNFGNAVPMSSSSGGSRSSRSSRKSRRGTPATTPGAVAVTDPDDAPLSPNSGSSSRSGKSRTTARATTPGAVAVATEEPDGPPMSPGAGGFRRPSAGSDSFQSPRKKNSTRKERRTTPAVTPGVVHVAAAANKGKEASVQEDQVEGGMHATATHVNEEEEEVHEDKHDAIRQELSGVQEDIDAKAKAASGRLTTGMPPGAVAVDGLVALQSVEDDAMAKKNADAAATATPGAQSVANTGESQDAVAMRKNPGGRTGRRGRRNRGAAAAAATGATAATVAATGAGGIPAVDEDEYRSRLENKVKDSEHDYLGENVDNTNAFDLNPADDDNGDKAPFELEDEPFASPSGAPFAAQQPVITTADRGTGVAPDVMPGTMDGYAGPGHRAGDDDQLAIAIAVEDDDGFDYNMGLPVGVEYDPDAKPTILKNVRFRFYAIAIVLLFAMIILAVILGTVVFKPKAPAPATYPPTEAPSNAPSSTLGGKYRAQFLPNVGPAVNVPETPQDRAARWIIDEDPMNLPLDSDFLVQRYLLAVFYFSTTNNGENPWRSCNPPGPDSDETECDLLKFVRNPDDSISYVPEPSTRWLSNTHECEWAGNLCDDIKVTRALDLIGQNITGTLPKELSSFDVLQSIALAYNEFTGTLPSEYAGMRHLLNLEVHGNNLSGEIPNEYFQATSLQNLNLGDNMFSGTLSTEIGQLTNLKGFQSFQNIFTGTFPTEIASLRFLSFSRNHDNIFEGTIPSVLGELTLLQELWMNGNQFNGTLPTEIGRMNDMMDLRFHQNKLTGTIPEEYYDLVFLFRLDLFSNYFIGTLSSAVGNLTEMEQFRVSRNQLTGTIPTEIAQMTQLQLAWLHSNQMVGSMPTQVCFLRPRPLLFLQTDCHPEGNEPNSCECCSACCNRETEICQILDDNA